METTASTTQYNTTRTVSKMASENTEYQVVPNVWSSLNKKRERKKKKSLTLGLKTILIYCSNDAFKGGWWNKINFSPLPIIHRRVMKPLKFKNLSQFQYQFFFPFNEKLNVILIVYKIFTLLVYLFRSFIVIFNMLNSRIPEEKGIPPKPWISK